MPAEKLAEVWRVLYGNNAGAALQSVSSVDGAAARAASSNFDLQQYRFIAAAEQLRPPRVIRVGLIQHSIVLPTTDPYDDQRQVRSSTTLLTLTFPFKCDSTQVCTNKFNFCTCSLYRWAVSEWLLSQKVAGCVG